MRQLPPIGPVPTEEELYRLAETDAAAAVAAYRKAIRVVPGATLFREHVLARAARFAATSEDSAIIMGNRAGRVSRQQRAATAALTRREIVHSRETLFDKAMSFASPADAGERWSIA